MTAEEPSEVVERPPSTDKPRGYSQEPKPPAPLPKGAPKRPASSPAPVKEKQQRTAQRPSTVVAPASSATTVSGTSLDTHRARLGEIRNELDEIRRNQDKVDKSEVTGILARVKVAGVGYTLL